MIISNWKITRHMGEVRLSGQCIDNPNAADGKELLTSPIMHTDNSGFRTRSGSLYYLGAPHPEQDLAELDTLRTQLLSVTNPTPQPFTAIIEEWAPDKSRGIMAISGTVYGHSGAQDGTPISTNEIVAADGNMLVTRSGSRYVLGTGNERLPPNAKARLVGSLHSEGRTAEHTHDHS